MNTTRQKSNIIAGLLVAAGFSSNGYAGEVRVVRYSKEEIKAAANPQFVSGSDLSDVLSTQLKALAVTLTSRQSGQNASARDAVASTNQMSKALWMKKLSTLSFDPDSYSSAGDENKVRSIVSAQTRKSAEVNFKNAFPVISRIQKGLNFNLDLKNPTSAIASKSAVPEIKYGLVESDILPGDHQIPIAALGSMGDIDARYSSPAKVVYTIDKLDSASSKTVFAPSEINNEENQNVSMWRRLPSPNVRVKIDAADQNSAMADQVGTGSATPAMRVTLSQADGFITSQMTTGANAKDSITTELKAPLYGEMSVARKFDSKFQPNETSAQNILGSSALPRVNLVYAHKAKTTKGEWIVKRDRFEYSVTAEPRAGWAASGDHSFGKVGDKVSLAVNTNF